MLNVNKKLSTHVKGILVLFKEALQSYSTFQNYISVIPPCDNHILNYIHYIAMTILVLWKTENQRWGLKKKKKKLHLFLLLLWMQCLLNGISLPSELLHGRVFNVCAVQLYNLCRSVQNICSHHFKYAEQVSNSNSQSLKLIQIWLIIHAKFLSISKIQFHFTK